MTFGSIKAAVFGVFLRNKLRQLSTWAGIVAWVVAAVGLKMPETTQNMFAQALLALAGAVMVYIDEYRKYNPKEMPSVEHARAVGEQLRDHAGK